MLKCKKDAEMQEAALREEGKTGQEATKKQPKKGQVVCVKMEGLYCLHQM